jgi:hypothetical protein
MVGARCLTLCIKCIPDAAVLHTRCFAVRAGVTVVVDQSQHERRLEGFSPVQAFQLGKAALPVLCGCEYERTWVLSASALFQGQAHN